MATKFMRERASVEPRGRWRRLINHNFALGPHEFGGRESERGGNKKRATDIYLDEEDEGSFQSVGLWKGAGEGGERGDEWRRQKRGGIKMTSRSSPGAD